MSPEKENIFLFYPNLIGYGRIILAIISFWFMPTNYIIAGWCYITSAGLDAFDGHAARYFNQSTRFGAMLDQLTDRCGTMCLMVTLSYFYPKYMFLFQISMAIDIACHWFYMQTSIIIGKTSHKAFDLNENIVMRIYYQKDILTAMCAANELFYCSLYLLYFTSGPILFGYSLFKITTIFCFPFALLKAFISCVHAYVAALDLAMIDIKERSAVQLSQGIEKLE